MVRALWTVSAVLVVLLVSGCVLAPPGTSNEKTRLDVAGKPFEPAVENREIPELPDTPTWREVLRRAFLTNGELEASYFQWKAAMYRIDQAATWPNSNVS